LDISPTKTKLPTSYYVAKRLVSKLGLTVKQIDYCVNRCMLFYDNDTGKKDVSLLLSRKCLVENHPDPYPMVVTRVKAYQI